MRATRTKLGRPARLSRERIVAVALESDLSTLTMRDLAARLEVSHSALYRWVASRASISSSTYSCADFPPRPLP